MKPLIKELAENMDMSTNALIIYALEKVAQRKIIFDFKLSNKKFSLSPETIRQWRILNLTFSADVV